MVVAAAVSAAAVTGVTSGNLGLALKSAAIAAVTALAFDAVGDATGHTPAFGSDAYFENVAGHAAVGCGSALLSGGSCESGALAAGFSAAAGPVINDGNRFSAGSLVANAVVGGVGSVAGGGKFANGAVTGAFGYLFNAAAGRFAGGVAGGVIAGALGVESGPLDVPVVGAGDIIGGAIGSAVEDLAVAAANAVETFWPGNNGFLGDPTREFLYPGDQIDRYGGGDYSRFFSPAGTPLEARSLPPDTASQPLRTFEVLKPFEVEAGTVAPAFGQLGLGTQYRTPVPLGSLLDRGIIREVTP